MRSARLWQDGSVFENIVMYEEINMRIAKLALAAVMLSVCASAQAGDGKTQEEKLAKALEGRTAGAPVDCINQRDIRNTRIFDRIAILYEMNNGTYYLNRPTSGASSLSWGDVLVTDTHSNQLCSIDIVKLYDNGTHMQSGFVGLDKFVPYTKPKK